MEVIGWLLETDIMQEVKNSKKGQNMRVGNSRLLD